MDKSIVRILSITFVTLLPSFVFAEGGDEEIKEKIIRESLSAYPGSCPCPYNTDRAGRRCGKRSAYFKPGGYAPIYFKSDITPKMIEQYKRAHQ